jgi:hypothetical protein
MTNHEQADAMILMLLISGRATKSEDDFAMCHDDVMMLLELIRARIMDITDCSCHQICN